jgi:hypothetical protein
MIELRSGDPSGAKDIVVRSRDFENSPSVDSIITTYKYVDDKWRRASMLRTKTNKYIFKKDFFKARDEDDE